MDTTTTDIAPAIRTRLAGIRLLALDVDGVLTDGTITYGSDGTEHTSFNIKDGLGIKLVREAGIQVAVITGRHSRAVERRAAELNMDILIQGRDDKYEALLELLDETGFELSEAAYIGDDVPDRPAIEAAGLGISVADGHHQIRAVADWVTSLPGGHGAVREVCDALVAQAAHRSPATGDPGS